MLDYSQPFSFSIYSLSLDIMVNWNLNGCCGDTEEIVFLSLYAVYTILTYFLMERAIAKPLKLIAIFTHEMGQ